jgi:hypothetical protein
VASGTLTDKPVQPFTAFWTAPGFFLHLKPSVDTMPFHVSQVVYDTGVVRHTVHNVHFRKIPKPLAGKFGALKAPGYPFVFGAPAKSILTFHTERHDPVRKTAVTTDIRQVHVICLCYRGKLYRISLAGGQVVRARPAVEPADASH